MLRLTQGIDGMGFPIIAGMQQSDTIYVNVMVANTAQYVTVPSGANFVLFACSGNNDFYMLLGVTSGLTVPSATATESAGALSIPELNPLLRQLNGAAHIGLITTAACVITMAFYC
jgi:hypothetical protein